MKATTTLATLALGLAAGGVLWAGGHGGLGGGAGVDEGGQGYRAYGASQELADRLLAEGAVEAPTPEAVRGGASHGVTGLPPTTTHPADPAADPSPAATSLSPAFAPVQQERPRLGRRNGKPYYEYYFTRAIYSEGRGFGRRWGGGRSWRIDWPEADIHFTTIISHYVNSLDVYEGENSLRFDDPEIRKYPFVYMLEVGNLYFTPEEREGLRNYLLAGGFLVVDDFWGTYEWANWEHEITQVLPEYPIVQLDLSHPIFHSFYEIEEIIQVPNVSQGRRGGPTHEADGYTPYVLGIFDEKDRLMVIINFNTDLGDAWEWANDPYYPREYVTYAVQMGMNMIVYSMAFN